MKASGTTSQFGDVCVVHVPSQSYPELPKVFDKGIYHKSYRDSSSGLGSIP